MSEWFAWPRLGANSERVLPDCCFIDVGVLVPEMFPVVSARGAVVPMSLPAITEVSSSAVFAGGVVADAAPPGRCRDSHGLCVCPAGCWK